MEPLQTRVSESSLASSSVHSSDNNTPPPDPPIRLRPSFHELDGICIDDDRAVIMRYDEEMPGCVQRPNTAGDGECCELDTSKTDEMQFLKLANILIHQSTVIRDRMSEEIKAYIGHVRFFINKHPTINLDDTVYTSQYSNSTLIEATYLLNSMNWRSTQTDHWSFKTTRVYVDDDDMNQTRAGVIKNFIQNIHQPFRTIIHSSRVIPNMQCYGYGNMNLVLTGPVNSTDIVEACKIGKRSLANINYEFTRSFVFYHVDQNHQVHMDNAINDALVAVGKYFIDNSLNARFEIQNLLVNSVSFDQLAQQIRIQAQLPITNIVFRNTDHQFSAIIKINTRFFQLHYFYDTIFMSSYQYLTGTPQLTNTLHND